MTFEAKCRLDEINLVAGYLSFICLLSFVPFITVCLSVFSAFPIFSDAQSRVEDFIFANFLPNSGAEIQLHLQSFIDNAKQMSTFGLIALFIIVLMLLKTIDGELNRIFSAKRKRPIWKAALIYLAVIVGGPIFIGASLIATTAFLTLDWIASVFSWFPVDVFSAFLPLLFSFSYFWLLYRFVPLNRPATTAAVVGALCTSLLFEASKYGFSWYLSILPTYELLYGSLAVVPILCLWIYLAWWLVLLGAELTSVLSDKLHQTSE